MEKQNNDYYEMSVAVLLNIAGDIMERALKAGLTPEFMSHCVVRLPKDQEENTYSYDLGYYSEM